MPAAIIARGRFAPEGMAKGMIMPCDNIFSNLPGCVLMFKGRLTLENVKFTTGNIPDFYASFRKAVYFRWYAFHLASTTAFVHIFRTFCAISHMLCCVARVVDVFLPQRSFFRKWRRFQFTRFVHQCYFFVRTAF